MKAHAKSPKVPVIEIMLVLIAVGLIGFVIWYVQDAKKAAQKTLNQADVSSNSERPGLPEPLFVSAAKLPKGWQIQNNTDGLLMLASNDTQCSAQTHIIANDNATSTAEYQQQTVDSIKAKGYSVRNLGATKQTLQGQSGSVTVPANNYRIKLDGASTYQSYGVIIADNRSLTTQVSCPVQKDLTAANAALQAITVNRSLSF